MDGESPESQTHVPLTSEVSQAGVPLVESDLPEGKLSPDSGVPLTPRKWPHTPMLDICNEPNSESQEAPHAKKLCSRLFKPVSDRDDDETDCLIQPRQEDHTGSVQKGNQAYQTKHAKWIAHVLGDDDSLREYDAMRVAFRKNEVSRRAKLSTKSSLIKKAIHCGG